MQYDNLIQLTCFFIFQVTHGRLRLYFNAGKIAHFSSTYEKVN